MYTRMYKDVYKDTRMYTRIQGYLYRKIVLRIVFQNCTIRLHALCTFIYLVLSPVMVMIYI